METISSKQLMSETGLTYRTLDYWVSNGVIPTVGDGSPGSGGRRKFDKEIVPKVQLMLDVTGAFDHKLTTEMLKRIYNSYEEGIMHLDNDIFLSW